MIKKIIKCKIAKIIAGKFCISQVLVKSESERSTGFTEIKVVTITGLCFTIWKITDLITKCRFTANIPCILFIIQVEEACGYVGILIGSASPHICIDKGQA